MDNLPRFSSRETRGLLIAPATIASRYQWPVGTSLISFRFTYPSKFSIAIKCHKRQGLLASMNQKGKGNGHWPGAVQKFQSKHVVLRRYGRDKIASIWLKSFVTLRKLL
ncbi:hypothetical protein ALC53_04114 [Atta colombica]|uniref:Uncharacterized protein n=1 Tax=Atta colombica TaxID=520822 RepID=A0A195BL87_9HYME|nr:hypothetical protein ALC53_04114 [Atta colombica]